MRCDEAKRRLKRGSLDDAGLKEHLRGCSSCARLAAERFVEQALDEERRAPRLETTSFNLLRRRLQAQAVTSQRTQREKEHSIMSRFTKTLFSHPRLSVGLAAGLCCILALALVPVSCSRTTGYDVDIVGSDSATADRVAGGDSLKMVQIKVQHDGSGPVIDLKGVDQAKINEALAELGYDNVNVNVNVNHDGLATIHISDLPTEGAAREIVEAVTQLTGIEGDVTITPVKESIPGTALSHIHHSFTELLVDTDGKTDEEIEAEIAAKLEEAGFTGSTVDFMTMEDGSKRIFIGAEQEGEDGAQMMQEFELQFMDSCDDSAMFHWNGEGEIPDSLLEHMEIIYEEGEDGKVKVEKRILIDTE